MYSMKREQNMIETNDEEDNEKRGKYAKTKFYISKFEDLSNEILYEIFEYVDVYHLYKTFAHLNSRFEHLIVYLSIPLRINLPFTHKSIVQYYCKHIIRPNIHRIISLHLPSYLINEFFFKLFTIDVSFVRLESLILHDFNTHNIVPLLTSLMVLPRLYSLTLCAGDNSEPLEDVGHLYQLIFRLPKLKYGKFSFPDDGICLDLSIPIKDYQQEYSPIEYLIINGFCRIVDFNAILSYTPRLRYFSCEYLSSFECSQMEVSIIPLYLTNLSIKTCLLSFDEFQLFIIKICSTLKLLRIGIRTSMTFLDANRWQWLISNSMPCLSIFDFEHLMFVKTVENMHVYHTMIKQFTSSFWIERQWFFAHQHCAEYSRMKFYSTQPYRRRTYQIFERSNNDTCSCRESGLNFARVICVNSQHVLPNCSIQFVHARSLRLPFDNVENKEEFVNKLTHSIPLVQIHRLNIWYSNLSTDLLIEILCCLPNLDSLSFYYRPLEHVSTPSIKQEAQMAHLMSKNKITKLNMVGVEKNTLEDLQFLFNLCPQLQHLEIKIEENTLGYIAQIILSNPKDTRSHLFLLLIWNTNEAMVNKLRTMIGDDYTFEYIGGCLHIWW